MQFAQHCGSAGAPLCFESDQADAESLPFHQLNATLFSFSVFLIIESPTRPIVVFDNADDGLQSSPLGTPDPSLAVYDFTLTPKAFLNGSKPVHGGIPLDEPLL